MTLSQTDPLDRLRRACVVAVIRAPDAAGAIRAVDALVRGGVTGIEITYSTPDVPRVLRAVAEHHGDAVLLGAGTLRTAAHVREAVAAGAEFLVSPGLDDELVAAMLASGATTMAGALTPTEVMRADQLGVHVVKLFPASLGGPEYVRSLRGPFPDTPFHAHRRRVGREPVRVAGSRRGRGGRRKRAVLGRGHPGRTLRRDRSQRAAVREGARIAPPAVAVIAAAGGRIASARSLRRLGRRCA